MRRPLASSLWCIVTCVILLAIARNAVAANAAGMVTARDGHTQAHAADLVPITEHHGSASTKSPSYALHWTALPNYVARFTVVPTDASTTIHGMSVLVYADASSRYGVTSPNTTSCTFDSTNASLSCGVAALGAGGVGSWSFDVEAQTPSYYTKDVLAWVHIRPSDAAWQQLQVRLTRQTATVAPDECDDSFVSFLVTTVAFFVAVLFLRTVLGAMRRRREAGLVVDQVAKAMTMPAAPDAVTWKRAAAMLHMYAGFVWPCHHYCGVIHTMQMLVHVLTLFAVVSTLLKQFGGLANDSLDGLLVLGFASAQITLITQPLFTFAYAQYKLVDVRPSTELVAEGGDAPFEAPSATLAHDHNEDEVIEFSSSDDDDDVNSRPHGDDHLCLGNSLREVALGGDSPTVVTECFEVRNKLFVVLSHVLSVVAAMGLLLFTTQNTGTWCKESVHTFFVVLGIAVAFDVTLHQGLFIAVTLGFRWMQAEVDDHGATLVQHELHAIDGQRRYSVR